MKQPKCRQRFTRHALRSPQTLKKAAFFSRYYSRAILNAMYTYVDSNAYAHYYVYLMTKNFGREFNLAYFL